MSPTIIRVGNRGSYEASLNNNGPSSASARNTVVVELFRHFHKWGAAVALVGSLQYHELRPTTVGVGQSQRATM